MPCVKIDKLLVDFVKLRNDAHFTVCKRWQNLAFSCRKCDFLGILIESNIRAPVLLNLLNSL